MGCFVSIKTSIFSAPLRSIGELMLYPRRRSPSMPLTFASELASSSASVFRLTNVNYCVNLMFKSVSNKL